MLFALALGIGSLSEEEMTQHLKGLNLCTQCDFVAAPPQEESLLVCISFSVPKESWVSLSNEVEKTGGAFIVRGLPDNSFQQLAYRVKELKDAGVNVPIHIDPRCFKKYLISEVPSFVVVDGGRYDKVAGNISLKGALELMAQEGETEKAKELSRRIQ